MINKTKKYTVLCFTHRQKKMVQHYLKRKEHVQKSYGPKLPLVTMASRRELHNILLKFIGTCKSLIHLQEEYCIYPPIFISDFNLQGTVILRRQNKDNKAMND